MSFFVVSLIVQDHLILIHASPSLVVLMVTDKLTWMNLQK